ncbi:unnamed protein product [Macrosiphum euphorbiae]|uniref:Uncharacterized protein n=1 Tax=Macrosiphum euphorbiae TaxID=13131 RepID=A0AAV0WXJ1_9HEMI|nr:unnamed protein product [Macrosiphum euphorbiae]
MDVLKEIQERIAEIQTLYPDHMNCGQSSKFTTCQPLEFAALLEKFKEIKNWLADVDLKNKTIITLLVIGRIVNAFAGQIHANV